MSGEMLATGPAELGEADTRPYDLTPYSHTWWAGSPYRSFKDFMEHMNRNDAGLYRTSVCTAIVDEGGELPKLRVWTARLPFGDDVRSLVQRVGLAVLRLRQIWFVRHAEARWPGCHGPFVHGSVQESTHLMSYVLWVWKLTSLILVLRPI